MFQDILTDFTVDAEKIPIEGGDANWFGHKVYWFVLKLVAKLSSQNKIFVVNLKWMLWTYCFCLSQGMIKVALYLKKKLEGGILEKAFNSDPVRNFIDSWFLIHICFCQIRWNKV